MNLTVLAHHRTLKNFRKLFNMATLGQYNVVNNSGWFLLLSVARHSQRSKIINQFLVKSWSSIAAAISLLI